MLMVGRRALDNTHSEVEASHLELNDAGSSSGPVEIRAWKMEDGPDLELAVQF